MNHGLTQIKGVFPDYRLCSFKEYTHKNGKKQYYYDYSVFDQEIKKIKRVIKKAPLGMKKRESRKWAAPKMSLIDSLLQQGYHVTNEDLPELLPIPEAIEYFLQDKLMKVKSHKDYHTVFQFLSEYAEEKWKGKKITDIGKREIKLFLDHEQRERNWTNQTRNHKKHLISSMFEYYKDLETIDTNPCHLVRNEKKQGVKHFEVFSIDHAMQLRDMIREENFQLYVAINLIYYCFLRPDSLRFIKVGHFSMTERTLLIHAGDVKDNDMRYIYLTDKMVDILSESQFLNFDRSHYLFSKDNRPGTKQLSYHYLRRKFKKYLVKMGLDDTHSFYCWKPTGICQMYQQTKDIMAIKEQGGFSSLDIVQIYLSKYNMLFKHRVNFV